MPFEMDNARPERRTLLPLLCLTIGLSAALVIAVQPMFTKMVLPLFGGGPEVWSAAVLFFQTMLLLGYLYVHLTTRWLGERLQAYLHLLLLAGAIWMLPIGIGEGWDSGHETSPLFRLFGLFATALGLPFLALAATAPLLQRWFSLSGHPAAHDPYFLYAASNVGSIGALLSYPLLLEPLLRLDEQNWLWTGLFGLLAGLVVLCAFRLLIRIPEESPSHAAAPAPVSWARRGHWIILAFVPSTLLLGVTRHISTDIAAVPLLWVIPLTLYLLSFVLVFARKPPLKHAWMVRAQPLFLTLLAVTFWSSKWPPEIYFTIHVGTFFVTAMVCHGELNARRPAAENLTEFYLWLAFGGALGGIFTVVVAPLVFDRIWEYPIALIVACLIRPSRNAREARPNWRDLLWPVVIFLLFALPLLLSGVKAADFSALERISILAGLAIAVFLSRTRPVRFGLAVGVALSATLLLVSWTGVIERARSFYGIHTVAISKDGAYRFLIHGTTVQGAQHVDPKFRRAPLTYYHRDGPLGQLFNAYPGFAQVGVVGLGAGASACYRRPGEAWSFYEIDTSVIALATDAQFFTYLSDCAPEAPIIPGDGRLSLAREPDGHFDFLFIDTYSSDSIPVHMLTREAFALYARKLRPGGLLLAHITNRHLSLEPVVVNAAAAAGLTARVQTFEAEHTAKRDGSDLGRAYSSQFVAMAPDPANLRFLDSNPAWRRTFPTAGQRPWTDDYADLVGALRW